MAFIQKWDLAVLLYFIYIYHVTVALGIMAHFDTQDALRKLNINSRSDNDIFVKLHLQFEYCMH